RVLGSLSNSPEPAPTRARTGGARSGDPCAARGGAAEAGGALLMKPRAVLILALALGLLAAPLAAEAQQAGKGPRIGYLSASSPSSEGLRRKGFSDGLRDLGWIEGQNVLVEERWAAGHYDKLPDLAAELVKLKPEVIVAAGDTTVIRPLRAATSAIP